MLPLCMPSRWEVAVSKGFLSSELGPQLQRLELSLSSSHLPEEPTWRTPRVTMSSIETSSSHPSLLKHTQTGRRGGGCFF